MDNATFYMVCSRGTDKTRARYNWRMGTIHNTRESAFHHAEQSAKSTPGTEFFVLSPVVGIKEPGPVIRRIVVEGTEHADTV